MKCFCTPRPIKQTPTKLPVNIQSNNEIKHSVACYRCIFINHNIVHNKTNTVGTNKKLFITLHQLFLTTKKHSDMQMLRKGFEKCFLISNKIENKFLANSLK